MNGWGNMKIRKKEPEKSVGTTELHYSTKKRYHVLTILKRRNHETEIC